MATCHISTSTVIFRHRARTLSGCRICPRPVQYDIVTSEIRIIIPIERNSKHTGAGVCNLFISAWLQLFPLTYTTISLYNLVSILFCELLRLFNLQSFLFC